MEINKINAVLQPKEELLEYAYKRQEALRNEKKEVDEQIAELKETFQCLKGKDRVIDQSAEGLKDRLYKIVKEKNIMEIALEENKVNCGFYKVSTFVIVLLC